MTLTSDTNMLRAGTAALAALLMLAVLKICLRFIQSPFRSIPGPFLAKLTSKWILLHGLCANRSNITRQLHKRYGPIVQLGPCELSFISASAINAIYGATSTTRKPASYKKFGRTGMFNLQDPIAHKERRKRMGDTYSMKAALRWESFIEDRIRILLQLVNDRLNQSLDMLHWHRLMVVDVASGVLWGNHFGAMEGADPPELMACLNGSFLSWSLRYHAPLLHKLLTSLPFQRLQHLFNIDQFLYKSGQNAVTAHIETHGRESKQDTLLATMLRGDPGKGLEPMPDHDVAIEAANAIFAATEATSNTLACAQFELAQHPDWQQRLRDELEEAKSGSASSTLDFRALNGLPILNGVVQETLRLHPACAYAPRQIPNEGALIDGIVVPGGCIVSVSAMVSQFNPEAFPDPTSFSPGRWEHSNQAMRDMMMVWTKGVRVCAGQNLALLELKATLARMVERFSLRLASPQTIRDMEGINIEEVLVPKGRKCMLVFDHVESPKGAELAGSSS